MSLDLKTQKLNNLNPKSLGAAFGLGLCLVLTVLINMQAFKSDSGRFEQAQEQGRAQAPSSRNPASQMILEVRSGTIALEQLLAKRLATVKNRGIASLGRPADLFENLRFGILEGKYAVKMEDEKLSEINFVDTPESESRPSAINNRLEFMKKFGILIGIKGQPVKVGINSHGSKIIETYRAKSSSSDTDIIVSFTLDDLDRVFNVHVEKISALNIF